MANAGDSAMEIVGAGVFIGFAILSGLLFHPEYRRQMYHRFRAWVSE